MAGLKWHKFDDSFFIFELFIFLLRQRFSLQVFKGYYAKIKFNNQFKFIVSINVIAY